jgi:hypothetical protein
VIQTLSGIDNISPLHHQAGNDAGTRYASLIHLLVTWSKRVL